MICYWNVLVAYTDCFIIYSIKKTWFVSGDEESDAQLSSSVTRLSAEGK